MCVHEILASRKWRKHASHQFSTPVTSPRICTQDGELRVRGERILFHELSGGVGHNGDANLPSLSVRDDKITVWISCKITTFTNCKFMIFSILNFNCKIVIMSNFQSNPSSWHPPPCPPRPWRPRAGGCGRRSRGCSLTW